MPFWNGFFQKDITAPLKDCERSGDNEQGQKEDKTEESLSAHGAERLREGQGASKPGKGSQSQPPSEAVFKKKCDQLQARRCRIGISPDRTFAFFSNVNGPALPSAAVGQCFEASAPSFPYCARNCSSGQWRFAL